MMKAQKSQSRSRPAMPEAGRMPSTDRDLRQNDSGHQQMDDEPELPEGYRHVRSALEVLLECA